MPAFDQLSLRTERLVLRPLRVGDAQALFDIFSDASVMRYWSTPPWTSMDQAHAMVARDVETMATGEHLRLGIERSGLAGLIGTCALFSIHANFCGASGKRLLPRVLHGHSQYSIGADLPRNNVVVVAHLDWRKC